MKNIGEQSSVKISILDLKAQIGCFRLPEIFKEAIKKVTFFKGNTKKTNRWRRILGTADTEDF